MHDKYGLLYWLIYLASRCSNFTLCLSKNYQKQMHSIPFFIGL